jgi:hypothetical protein
MDSVDATRGSLSRGTHQIKYAHRETSRWGLDQRMVISPHLIPQALPNGLPSSPLLAKTAHAGGACRGAPHPYLDQDLFRFHTPGKTGRVTISTSAFALGTSRQHQSQSSELSIRVPDLDKDDGHVPIHCHSLGYSLIVPEHWSGLPMLTWSIRGREVGSRKGPLRVARIMNH